MYILLIIIFIILIWLIGYHNMVVQKYTIKSKKIHTPIHIGIISDLHGTNYGKNQSNLIKEIKQQKLDLILFVGDMIDEYSGTKEVEDLFNGVQDIPCFYVFGNHEISSQKKEIMIDLSKKYGIHMIGEKYETLNINDTKIIIAGIDDILSFQDQVEDPMCIFKKELMDLSQNVDKKTYSILLSHKPSLVDLYKNSQFDLIVSGHAHGGQWRIPHILNGLYAPDEFLFPHYAGGLYQLGHNQLLVGRGLVKNFIPRFFNPPELVVLTLNNTK